MDSKISFFTFYAIYIYVLFYLPKYVFIDKKKRTEMLLYIANIQNLIYFFLKSRTKKKMYGSLIYKLRKFPLL